MGASQQVVIYGIKNCDTMKKARKWLDVHRVAYACHDFAINIPLPQCADPDGGSVCIT